MADDNYLEVYRLILPVNNRSLDMIRNDIRARMTGLPGAMRSLSQTGNRLRLLGSTQAILSQAAAVITEQRNNPAMFASFSQNELDIKVESSSGFLKAGYQQFGCETPTTGLIARALIERSSIHIPEISRAEIEAVGDQCLIQEKSTERAIRGALPLEFSKKTGAALLTPLGLERSSKLGFGFIFEYRESGRFTLQSAIEARAYAELFTLHLASRQIREMSPPKNW